MKRFGKYAVVKKVGEGGFGEVFLARDPVLGRDLAIKTCGKANAEDQQRFLREAQIAAALRHPNLVILHDFGFEGQEPYFVQEYLDGEDLDRKIKRQENLSTARKVEILLQVALGLGYAHDQGVVHRDIKPGNVRVLEDGQVKIMDFGIAKLLSSDLELTQTGVTMGTAGYIAPEHIRGETVGPEADIFAFGVLAYELLTYIRPFRADTLSAVLYRIVHEEPPALSEVWPSCPKNLAALVEQCMKKDPKERPRGFAVIADTLESLSEIELPDDLRMRSTESVVAPASFDPSMELEKTTRTRSSISDAFQIFRRVRGRTLLGVVAGGLFAILLLGPWGLPRLFDGSDQDEGARSETTKTTASAPRTPETQAATAAAIVPPTASGPQAASADDRTPIPVSVTSDSTPSRKIDMPFSGEQAIALIASDAKAAALLQSTIRQRVERVLLYPDIAAAVADRKAGQGAGSALVVSIEESTGTSSAYGTQISSCRAVVTAQHLSLPDRALLFSSTAEGKGPDCAEARSGPLGEVADAILVNLEGSGAPPAPASLQTLALELASPLGTEELDQLLETLRGVPGIRHVEVRNARSIELGLDRDPGQVARDLDALSELRIEKIEDDSLKARFLG